MAYTVRGSRRRTGRDAVCTRRRCSSAVCAAVAWRKKSCSAIVRCNRALWRVVAWRKKACRAVVRWKREFKVGRVWRGSAAAAAEAKGAHRWVCTASRAWPTGGAH
eukprot:scaffold192554_cov24-Tisochrysis_lutea.AAC.1